MSSSVKEETQKTGTEAVKTIINVPVHRSHGGTTGVQLSSWVYGEDINKTWFLCNIMGQEDREKEGTIAVHINMLFSVTSWTEVINYTSQTLPSGSVWWKGMVVKVVMYRRWI